MYSQAPKQTVHNTQPLRGLVLLYGATLSVVLSVLNRYYLNDYQLSDALNIASYFGSGGFDTRQNSYSRTAFLFESIGVTEPITLSLCAALLVVLSVLVAIAKIPTRGRTWLPIVAALGSLVLGGVYLGVYSKDFFVLPIIVIFLLTGRTWYTELAWLVPAFCFAITIRNYWFLVIALYFAWRLVLPAIRSLPQLLVWASAAAVAISVLFNSILGRSADFYRTSVNESLVSARQTEITDFFSSALPHMQALNLILVLLTLLVPVPLAFAGSFIHIVSAIAIGGLWVATIILFVKAQKVSTVRPVAQSVHLGSGASHEFVRPLSLLFAFVLTQSLFEPDYGSYIRHLTPLIPVFILVLGQMKAYVLDRADMRVTSLSR